MIGGAKMMKKPNKRMLVVARVCSLVKKASRGRKRLNAKRKKRYV